MTVFRPKHVGILATDQYKFAMAESGLPLREETFYYSHRKGGPHLIPYDVKDYIKNLFSNWSSNDAHKLLEECSGLFAGSWFNHFLKLNDPYSLLKINTIAKGTWFYDRDPVFTITGPSFLVSWLEPRVLQMNYAIQVATMAAIGKLHIDYATCENQKLIVDDVLETVMELGYTVDLPKLEIKSEEYLSSVKERVAALARAVNNDTNRLFEVGFRSATCMEQHHIALEACGKLGTSNTYESSYGSAGRAVGTMGHEHVQRFGSDKIAYNTMADRLPGSIFCLLDTFDALRSGIPAAFDLIQRQPERNHSVRFDSGDIKKQLLIAIDKAKEMGIKPKYCLEDSWDLKKTIEFEELRTNAGIEPEYFTYGFGGHIVNVGELTRDRVSAVWKLSQTGDRPTMKFGNAGKESIPGKPVLYHLINPNDKNEYSRSIVCQEDDKKINEKLYVNAFDEDDKRRSNVMPLVHYDMVNAYSNETLILRHDLMQGKNKYESM